VKGETMKLTPSIIIKTIILVFIAFVLTGCAQIQPTPSVCESPDAEGSIICKILYETGAATPEQANFILKLATGIMLENNPDKCESTMNFLNSSIALLESGIQYSTISNYITSFVPITLEITAEELLDGMLDFQVPINDFDKGLLIEHLEQQRSVVERVCKNG
jgi:hypothetical protein